MARAWARCTVVGGHDPRSDRAEKVSMPWRTRNTRTHLPALMSRAVRDVVEARVPGDVVRGCVGADENLPPLPDDAGELELVVELFGQPLRVG